MLLPKPQTIDINIKDNNLNNLKIIHLSDLHINIKTTVLYLKELVNICNSIKADFIVITGDIIDCKVKYISSKLDILNNFTKKVFYISGNHDLFYGLQDLKDILYKLTFLDNSYEIISFNDNNICIVGLSDRFSKFFNHKRDTNKIKHLLNNQVSTILLAHQPKDYKIATQTNTKLFLCGHTHGGQIFPFHYFVKLFQPFLNGLFYKFDTAIYVNKGLGTWGINYRYKADAEISILNLTSNGI